MVSLFARGDPRRVAGSRDLASLMAVFNPKALSKFVNDEIGMYVTPNGSGFRIGEIPLVHPESDEPADQPLGMIVWDLAVSVPHGVRRPAWAQQLYVARRDGKRLPQWARFPTVGETQIGGNDQHTKPFKSDDVCIWTADFFGRQWEYTGTIGGLDPKSEEFWRSELPNLDHLVDCFDLEETPNKQRKIECS